MVATSAEADQEERWDTKHLSDYRFELSPAFGSSPIIIRQLNDTDHHGTTVWDSAKVLVGYLEKLILQERASKSKLLADSICTQRWIELGAGCGLVSFALMRMGVRDITVTDHPDIVKILTRNAETNRQIMSCDGIASRHDSIALRINATALDWANVTDKVLKDIGAPFDKIVATDVVYERDIIDILISTIVAVSKEGTEILIGHENRDPEVMAEFVEHVASTGLFSDVKEVPKSRYSVQWTRDLIKVWKFKRQK